MKLSAEAITRMAGMGAIAVGGALIALFGLFYWFIAPSGVGIDSIESAVARMSVGLVVLALIAPHIIYGRILLTAARSDHPA